MRMTVTSSYMSDDVHVRSEKTPSTLSGFDSSPQAKKTTITLEFSWTIITKEWRLSSGPTMQCVSTDITPLPADQDSIIDLNIDQLMNSRSSHGIMSTMARSWPLSDSASQSLIEYALEKVRETLNSIVVPGDHDRLYLDFRMVKRLDNYTSDDHVLLDGDGDEENGLEEESDDGFDYDDLLDYLDELLADMSELQRLADGDGHMMIRTDESSIESLEKKTADSEGSCVVCMEDYSSGNEVTCMPCSHAFHEDCIKKWLRVSHYCPICRFKMPTICGDHKA